MLVCFLRLGFLRRFDRKMVLIAIETIESMTCDAFCVAPRVTETPIMKEFCYRIVPYRSLKISRPYVACRLNSSAKI
jgi:hypothetical protein